MSIGVAVSVPAPVYIVPTGELCPRLDLVLAGRRFSIEGIPAGWRELLPRRLLDCRTGQAVAPGRTIKIEISSDEHLRPMPEPHDLNDTSHLHCNHSKVRLESDWSESCFNIRPGSSALLRIHIEASPWFTDVLENLLRVLVAYDVLQRGGVMLHCAAIVKNGRAVVLFGHSGAGKSTASALALKSGYSVISDDINIIEPASSGWQVTPVPFSGTLNNVSEIVNPVHLYGLFRLHQSDQDYVQACSRARAVSLLMGSSPFVNQDSHRSAQLVKILSRLSAEPGVQDLYLTRSNNFLQHVFEQRQAT